MEDSSRAAKLHNQRIDAIRRWGENDTSKASDNRPLSDFKIKFEDGAMLLAAVTSGDMEETTRLLDHKANVNYANIDGLTSLHQACIDENLKMVKLLVDRGAAIDACDNEGWTPLHAAATTTSLEIVKLLVENGANVTAVNSEGELPVDLSDESKIRSYLEKELNSRNISLEEARRIEHKLLLDDAIKWQQQGFINDVRDKHGATALHVAASKSYMDVIRILLSIGADINCVDNDGWTPLHVAVYWKHQDVTDTLIESNANVYIKNNAGLTIFDIADEEMAPFLRGLVRKYKIADADKNERLGIYSNKALPNQSTLFSSRPKQALPSIIKPARPQPTIDSEAKPHPAEPATSSTQNKHTATLNIAKPPSGVIGKPLTINPPTGIIIKPPTTSMNTSTNAISKPPTTSSANLPTGVISRPPTASSANLPSGVISRPPTASSANLPSGVISKPPTTSNVSDIINKPSTVTPTTTSASTISRPPGLVSSAASGFAINKPPTSSLARPSSIIISKPPSDNLHKTISTTQLKSYDGPLIARPSQPLQQQKDQTASIGNAQSTIAKPSTFGSNPSDASNQVGQLKKADSKDNIKSSGSSNVSFDSSSKDQPKPTSTPLNIARPMFPPDIKKPAAPTSTASFHISKPSPAKSPSTQSLVLPQKKSTQAVATPKNDTVSGLKGSVCLPSRTISDPSLNQTAKPSRLADVGRSKTEVIYETTEIEAELQMVKSEIFKLKIQLEAVTKERDSLKSTVNRLEGDMKNYNKIMDENKRLASENSSLTKVITSVSRLPNSRTDRASGSHM